MKFQIDVDNKTVKLIEGGKLTDIERTLKNFLGAEYENYQLIVDYYVYWYPYPTYTWPYYYDGVSTTGNPPDIQPPTTGVYNLCVSDN